MKQKKMEKKLNIKTRLPKFCHCKMFQNFFSNFGRNSSIKIIGDQNSILIFHLTHLNGKQVLQCLVTKLWLNTDSEIIDCSLRNEDQCDLWEYILPFSDCIKWKIMSFWIKKEILLVFCTSDEKIHIATFCPARRSIESLIV